MARRLVRISLATKFRLLFGLAVLGIILAALGVPWYFMELLAEQALHRPAEELTRLRLNEWVLWHRERGPVADANSRLILMYTYEREGEGVKGPYFTRIKPDLAPERSLDSVAKRAHKAFLRKRHLVLTIIPTDDERGEEVYRCFRAVRVQPSCTTCHNKSKPVELQFQPGQLVAMIDVALPGADEAAPLVWWTRAAFLIGGVLAGLVALLILAVIIRRIVLNPVRELRDVADRVAEGDLSVRSTIQSGDELQRLGESFNDMLAAIAEQHRRLRAANQALDLKLNELAEVNVTLYQANKVKSEFLANVSHELRTPLNSILGFADLLGESLEERIRRYGSNISTAAKNLLNLINDLLDLAKIEAGRAQVNLDRVSVSDLCQTLAVLVGPLASKKRLMLRVDLADNLPIVTTDAGKLQQVLYNLLSNAIKFTPAGGQVKLSARAEPARGTPKEVLVTVADTGPGIAEADQQHIFEKFYQADGTLTKESGGTGLGLAIARELASLLGGRLTLKSSPGAGATFAVALPVVPRNAAAPRSG